MLVLKFKWSIYHKAVVLNSKGVFKSMYSNNGFDWGI